MDDRHPSCKPIGTSACPNRHARASRGKSSIDSTGRRTIEMLAAQHAKPNAQEPKRLQASTIVPIYPSDPASIAADARSDRGRASRRQVNGIRAVPQSLPRQATAHALHAEASATHAMWHGGVLPRVYVKPVCILLRRSWDQNMRSYGAAARRARFCADCERARQAAFYDRQERHRRNRELARAPVEVGSQDLAVDPSNLRCTSADTKRRNSTVSKMIENTAEKDLRS